MGFIMAALCHRFCKSYGHNNVGSEVLLLVELLKYLRVLFMSDERKMEQEFRHIGAAFAVLQTLSLL